MPCVSIVAVGSSHGDDQIGWRVIERLQRKTLPGILATAVSEAVRVLDHLGCETLVLVDACRSGARAGTIHRLSWPDPRLQGQNNLSTHGFGVIQALELAAALGCLPPHVVLLGVEALACSATAQMSLPVRRALPKLYRRVLAEVRRQGIAIGHQLSEVSGDLVADG
jgi:hydrogenase maturation protease